MEKRETRASSKTKNKEESTKDTSTKPVKPRKPAFKPAVKKPLRIVEKILEHYVKEDGKTYVYLVKW
jgi:hypothetical protein